MHYWFPSPEQEHRLLLKTPENVEKYSRELVLELGEKDGSEAVEVHGLLENLEKEGSETEVLDAFRRNLNGLNEQVHAQITSNLEALERDSVVQTKMQQLSKLKTVVHEVMKAAPQTTDKESILTQVANTLEKTTNKVLPKAWTDNMSRKWKVATPILATAGIAAAGALTWRLLKWLGGRAKNSAEEGKAAARESGGGWMKKILIGLGIGTLVFLGLHWYISQKFRLDENGKKILEGFFDPEKDNPIIPNNLGGVPVEEIVDGGAGGAYRGLDDIKEYFGSGFSELFRMKRVREVMEKRETYKTKVEFVQAIIGAVLREGGSFAWSEAGGMIYAGGKLISLECEFGKELWSLVTTGEVDAGSVVATYVEGAIVYGTSLQILKIITIGKYGKGASALWEAGLWPYYTFKRVALGVRSGAHAMRYGYEMTQSTGRPILSAQRRILSMQYRLPRLDSVWSSADGLTVRHAMLMDAMDMRVHATARGHAAIAAFEQLENKLLTNFQKYVQNLAKANKLPEWFTRIAEQKFPGISPRNLNVTQIRAIAQEAVPTAPASHIRPLVPNGATPRSSSAQVEVDSPRNTTPETSTQPQMRRAAGDGVVSEPQPLPEQKPVEVPNDRPPLRVVHEDGTVSEPMGRISDAAEEVPVRQSLDEVLARPASAANHEEVLRILNGPVADAAIEAGDTQLLQMRRAAQSLKFAPGKAALPCSLAAALSGVFILLNERDIKAAEEAGDMKEAELLKSKRTTLILEGVVGTASAPLVFAGPVGWAVIGGQVVVGITNEILYAYAREMGKEDADYLLMNDAELLSNVKKFRSDAHQESSLFAYLKHNTTHYTLTDEEKDALLKAFAEQDPNTPYTDVASFNAGIRQREPKALRLETTMIANRNDIIGAQKLSFLKRIAKDRGGDLSKLRSQDYEMASLYGDLVSLTRRHDTVENPGAMQAEIDHLQNKYSSLGVRLDTLDLSGVSGHELYKLLYKDFDHSWEKSDLAKVLTLERMQASVDQLELLKSYVHSGLATKEQAYDAFRMSMLSGVVGEQLKVISLVNSSPSYKMSDVDVAAEDALYTFIERTTQNLFEEIWENRLDEHAVLVRMDDVRSKLQRECSLLSNDSVAYTRDRASIDPESPHYSAIKHWRSDRKRPFGKIRRVHSLLLPKREEAPPEQPSPPLAIGGYDTVW